MCGAPERAFELVGAADALREEIGTPRAPGLDEELERHLAPARSTLGDEAAAEARGRGQALTLPDVLALALRVCDAGPELG
jgi:hypothetical protein